MKKIILALAILLLLACGSVQEDDKNKTNLTKKSVNIDDSTYAELLAAGIDSFDIAKIIERFENPYNEVFPTGNEVISSMMLVTPNPTSSSITIKFFNGFENTHLLLPENFIVDLFYIDKKIHTFTFMESKGIEVIPEEYLREEGMYRIATEWNGITFISTFMVRKNR